MSRSVWKGPFVDLFLLKNRSGKKNKRIFSRRSMILPQFVGQHFDIYNGKKFVHLFVTEEMIGHKFGEFSSTRQKCIHKKK